MHAALSRLRLLAHLCALGHGAALQLRLLILGLAFSTAAWAHNPILVDATVAVDGTQLQVVLEIKQAELLFAQHERRSLFVDTADFRRLEPAISQWLTSQVLVDADGQLLALAYDGITDPGSAELPDPMQLRLHATLPAGAHWLHVRMLLFADLGGNLSIIDNVHLEAANQQGATVKPGETATLDLSASPATPRSPSARVGDFMDFLRLGFFHIVPDGTDHILFVLGLFLLSPKLKPLLTQVTAFTIAHSLTLGLSLAGIFSLPSRIVEPMIALSIAVVAIENLTTKEVKSWRWMIVFGFGLVHGLGFAGALKDLHLPKGYVLKPLVGFNCGVELGQLTVIALAAGLTFWCWHKPWYRSRVVTPASCLIAGIGLFWAIQRGLGYGISP